MVVLAGGVTCVLAQPLVIIVALVSGRPLGWALCALPLMLALQLVLTLGPAIVLAAGNVYLRDIQQIIPPVMQALFVASPILYPASLVPTSLQPILALNPWTYLARSYQRILYDGRWPAAIDLAVLLALAIVVSVACESAFKRYRYRLAEEL